MLRPLLTSPLRVPLLVKPASVALAILLGLGSFAPGSLFLDTDPGIHLETYDPNTILRRRNQLTYSEQLDNAAYTKNGVTIAANASGTLDRITESALNEFHAVTQSLNNVQAGQTLVNSARLKAGERSLVMLDFPNAAMWGGVNPSATFNLANGTVNSTAFGAFGATIEPLGGGEYRCSVRATAVSAGSSGFRTSPFVGGSTVFLGDGVSGYFAGECQCERDTLTAYQAVTDWYTEFLAAGGDRVTMFQDSACTTPVVKAEDPIGAIISTERGAARGVELVANGNFNGTANWNAGNSANLAASGGQITVTNTIASAGSAGQAIPTVAGDFYEVTLIAFVGTGASRISVNDGAIQAYTGSIYNSNVATFGAQRFVFRAAGAQSTIGLYTNSTTIGQSSIWGAVSVKRIPGKVITQGTSGFRPVLRPLVNLLTKTQEFDETFWTKTDATVTANATAAPDGTMTGDLITEGGAGTGIVQIPGGVAVPGSGTPMRVRISLKRGNNDWVRLRLLDGTAANGANLWVNLAAGALGSSAAVGTGTGISASMEAQANGWYAFTLNATAPGATAYTIHVLSAAGDGSFSRVNGASHYLWGADLRTQADAALNIPAYQRVNTSTDYDTDGFPHRVKHDGSDDFFSVPLNMSTVNKVDVFIDGLLKPTDASVGVLLELTASSGANNGGFAVFAPPGAASANYGGRSRGTASSEPGAPTTFPAPRNDALALTADIAADVCTLDINGTQVATGVADQGAGNYANDTLYIGARGGASLRSGMGWCAITIRGSATANLTATQKARRCRWGQRLAKII